MVVDRSTEILILISPIAIVIVAYLIAWRGKNLSLRKAAALIVASLSALFGWVGTFRYALPTLKDSHDAFGAICMVLIWAACIGAWAIALRSAYFAVCGNHSSRHI
jgi:hypothetical protein